MNRSAIAKLLNTDEYSSDYQQITMSVSQHGFCNVISWYGSVRMLAICVGFEERVGTIFSLGEKRSFSSSLTFLRAVRLFDCQLLQWTLRMEASKFTFYKTIMISFQKNRTL